MSVNYVGSGNDDGVDFGHSTTSKIGFYGLTTPIVQPTLTLGVGDTTTALKSDMLLIKAALVALNLVV